VELSDQEKRAACKIAAQEATKREAQFKPEKYKSVLQRPGYDCEQIFMGADGDELVCAIQIVWNWHNASGTQRAYETIHVKLKAIYKDDKRFLRLVGYHLPSWTNKRGSSPYCTRCGEAFNLREVVQADTSLQEY